MLWQKLELDPFRGDRTHPILGRFYIALHHLHWDFTTFLKMNPYYIGEA